MAGVATPGGPSVPSQVNIGTVSSESSTNPFNLSARPLNYGVNHISWNNPNSSFPWTDYKLVRKFGGFATGETLELRVLAKELLDNVAILTLPLSSEIYEHMFINVSDVDSTFDGEYFINRTDSVTSISIETEASGSSGANTITVTSATGIKKGMEVTGTGIGDTAYVTDVSGTTITLSVNNAAALSSTDVIFSSTTIKYNLTSGNVSLTALSPAGSVEIWAYSEVIASGTNPSLFLGVDTIATATSRFNIDTYTGGGSIIIGDKPGDPEPEESTTGPLHDDVTRGGFNPANVEPGANSLLYSETYKNILDGDIIWPEVTVRLLRSNYTNRTLSFTGGFLNPGSVTLNNEIQGYVTVSQDKTTGPVQTISYTDFYSTVPTGALGPFRLKYIWKYKPDNVDSEGSGFNVAIYFPKELMIPSPGPGIPDLYQGIIYNSTLDLDPYYGIVAGSGYERSLITNSGENYAVGDTLRVDLNGTLFNNYKNDRNIFSETPQFLDLSGNPVSSVDITVDEIAVVTEEIITGDGRPRKIIDSAGNIYVEGGKRTRVPGTSSRERQFTYEGIPQASTSGAGYGAQFAIVYKEGPSATLTFEEDLGPRGNTGTNITRTRTYKFPTTRVIGIKVVNGGQDYAPGDTITISKESLSWANKELRGYTAKNISSLLNLSDIYTDITVTVREVRGGELELVDPVTPIPVNEVYLNVPQSSTTGSGSGATFDIYREGLSGTAIPVTNVVINNPGSGYVDNEVVTIDSESIGLSSRGAEDLLITCDAPVSEGGTISAVVYGDDLLAKDWYTLSSAPDGGTIVNEVKFNVINKELTSNVAILTLDDTPAFIVGDEVIVEGIDSTFNTDTTTKARTIITAVDTDNNTIEYAKTASDVPSTADTGTVELLFKYSDVSALTSFYKGTSEGYGATFDIYRRSTGPIYSVSINNKGNDYTTQSLLVVPKESLGYTGALRNVLEVSAENHVFDIGRDTSFVRPGLDYRSTFHQGLEVYYSMIVGYPTERTDLPVYYFDSGSTILYGIDPGDYIPAKEPLADVSCISVKDYNTLEWLFQNIPQIYRDLDDFGHLEAFLKIIAFKIDEFRTEIDFVFNRANPQKTAMKLINLGLQQMGIDDEAVRTLGLNKRALVNAIKMYKVKGTTRGLRQTLSIYGKPAQELTARPLADITYSRNKILDENSAGFEDGLGFWQPSLVTSFGAISPTLGLGYRTDTDALEISLTDDTSITPYYGINCGKLSNTTASTDTRSIVYGPKQIKITAPIGSTTLSTFEPLSLAAADEYIFDTVNSFEVGTQIESAGASLTLNQPTLKGFTNGIVYLSRTAQNYNASLSAYIPVVQNLPYVFEVKAKRDESNSDTIKVGIIWRDRYGDILSYDESGTTTKSSMGSGWVTVSETAVAPVGALYAQPYVTASLAASKLFYLDGLSFSQPEDVLTATRSSSVATLTIRNNGGSYAGSGSVTINGVGKDFDGTHTISTASTSDGITTITYSNSSTNYPSASVTNAGYAAVTSATIEQPQKLTTYVDFIEDSYTKARAVGVLQSAVKDTQLLSREEDSLQLPVLREESIYAYSRTSGTSTLALSYGTNVVFKVGEEITVSGVYDTTFNGTFIVTAASQVSIGGVLYNTVSYANAGSDVGESKADVVGFLARVTSTKYYRTEVPLTIGIDSAQATEVVRKSASITKKALTSNLVTLTIPDHKYIVGDSVQISNLGSPFDGTFTITATSYNTISYPVTNADITEVEDAGDSKVSVYHIKYVTNNNDCELIRAGYVVTISGTSVSAYNLTRQIVMDARFDGTTAEFILEVPTSASTSAATGGTAYFSNGLTDKPEVLPYEITRYTV